MKLFMLAMLLVGTALLGVILYRTDLAQVWAHLVQVGWGGLALLFAIYVVAFGAEAGTWLLTVPRVPVTPRWAYRFWKVLMVGHAFENVTPLAGLGGDPIKAILLKRHYGVPYREATASFFLWRTTDVISQVLFITVGFTLMYRAALLPAPYRIAAAAGFALFATAILLFFLAQRHRGFSRMRRWLERGPLGRRRLSERAVAALDVVHEVEDQLVAFYTAERRRFALAVGFALCNWVCNALVAYVALGLLGHPISFAEAVVIESFVVLVRSALFFVPGDVGTQEGAIILICGAITGSAPLGLAVAAIRRGRDLFWIAWGLLIGSAYSLRLEAAVAAEARVAVTESVDPESTRAVEEPGRHAARG